jgi:hypothetical protein
MVSKLKVSPFHNVNSPLDAPVINLLPSGVHVRQKTGQRILFVATYYITSNAELENTCLRIPRGLSKRRENLTLVNRVVMELLGMSK